MRTKPTYCFAIAIFTVWIASTPLCSLAAETSVRNERMKLHLINHSFHMEVDLPSGKEQHQPLSVSVKELLKSSFPALIHGSEAVINEVEFNSFSMINLLTGKKNTLHVFPDNLITGVAGGVDEHFVWVSTYARKFDGKYQIWKINRHSGETIQVVEARSLHFSIGCGKLAYVGNKHQIHLIENAENRNMLALHGDMPVLLPDCRGIVFATTSLPFQKLMLYEFKSGKKALAKSMMKGYAFPIRVSRNSKFVAFKYESDVTREQVHVVRIDDGKEIYSSSGEVARNWFFLTEMANKEVGFSLNFKANANH
jgi:hypothetical protein